MCIILHTRHCASFVQKRDVGISFFLFFFLFSLPQTRRGAFTQTDERRAGADVI